MVDTLKVVNIVHIILLLLLLLLLLYCMIQYKLHYTVKFKRRISLYLLCL